ncbi:hypothetical protein F5148DRAFT_1155039 [Russula earlei]|uniref:Uncharacterized protein n=1 Tax=Russula earlei TaxID=71964 RepID=A0ACC0TQH7_9AGAM|nr:hypothetical protein F5148DRAFT_1155039 [Russula earlei]
MEEEKYGISIEEAHERAKQLIPEDFFWNNMDELAPFGSDEGDMALAEFRDWRKANSQQPTLLCLQWVIKNVGEMNPGKYNKELLSREKIKAQMTDQKFDDYQYVYNLDTSIIATGFAQLVDEGIIEAASKEVIQIAIDRQIIRAELTNGWEYKDVYIERMRVLSRALAEA